jgi:hypothetical protein
MYTVSEKAAFAALARSDQDRIRAINDINNDNIAKEAKEYPDSTCDFAQTFVRLLTEFDKHPQPLFVTGVDTSETRHPYSAGGFADVFHGMYEGQSVAVKRLRNDERGEARDHFHRVQTISLSTCTKG